MISLASCAITPRSPPIPAASTDDTDGSVASDPPPFAPVPRWRTVPLCAPSAGSGVKVSDASEERPGSPVHAAPIATFPVPERTSAKSVSSASFASADVAGTTSFGSSSHSGAASAERAGRARRVSGQRRRSVSEVPLAHQCGEPRPKGAQLELGEGVPGLLGVEASEAEVGRRARRGGRRGPAGSPRRSSEPARNGPRGFRGASA